MNISNIDFDKILPGRYRRSQQDSLSSSSSSLWTEGELFSLKNNCFRFLNNANAFWSFRLLLPDDDAGGAGGGGGENDVLLADSNPSFVLGGGSTVLNAEIFESPEDEFLASSPKKQQKPKNDEKNKKMNSTSARNKTNKMCSIEVTREFVVNEEDTSSAIVNGQSYSVTFKLIEDGQTFSRFDNLRNDFDFPLATKFLTESLGHASVSLSTKSLREVTELQLRAQRQFLLNKSVSTEILSEIRQKYPMGSKKWKQQVKFVKENGPWYENYCLVRMLDFIERRMNQSDSTTSSATTTSSSYNITVIAMTETETNIPDSFEDFVSSSSSKRAGETDFVIKKRQLDERLMMKTAIGSHDEDDEEALCAEDKLLIDAMTAAEDGDQNDALVDFDENVPLPIRSMLFWWSIFTRYLGQEGNFGKTKVRYETFDKEAMQLFFDSSSAATAQEPEEENLIFPSFPWDLLTHQAKNKNKNDFDYNDTDQFIIIYPRAEPLSWSASQVSPNVGEAIKEADESEENNIVHNIRKHLAHNRFSVSGVRTQEEVEANDIDESDENESEENNTNNNSNQSSYTILNPRFTTSGITVAPTGRPVAVIDDRSLFEPDRCPGLELNHNLRSAYYAHWLLHETSHAWYEMVTKKRQEQEQEQQRENDDENSSPTTSISSSCIFYGDLNLEPFSHSWFDREMWPKDFVSESGLEEDYFFEAIEKRFLVKNYSGGDEKDEHWKNAITRKNWPLWAKLKNRPKQPEEHQQQIDENTTPTLRHQSSIFGEYRVENASTDSDFITVYAIISNNENTDGEDNDDDSRTQHDAMSIIKWQSKMKENPTILYRIEEENNRNKNNNKETIIRFANTRNIEDGDEEDQNETILVEFYRVPRFSSSTSAKPNHQQWIAAMTIGAKSAFPVNLFFQTQSKFEIYHDEDEGEEEDALRRALQEEFAGKEVSQQRKARRQKELLRKEREAKKPSTNKIDLVFESYARLSLDRSSTSSIREDEKNADDDDNETLLLNRSLTLSAIMNGLLPFVNTILIADAVKTFFSNSTNSDDENINTKNNNEKMISESQFRGCVEEVFQKWLFKEEEEY